MKRNVVMKMLCISVASAMLCSSSIPAMAADQTQVVTYDEEQMKAQGASDINVLAEGQEDAPAEAPAAEIPEVVPETETPTETPATGTTNTETPGTDKPAGTPETDHSAQNPETDMSETGGQTGTETPGTDDQTGTETPGTDDQTDVKYPEQTQPEQGQSSQATEPQGTQEQTVQNPSGEDASKKQEPQNFTPSLHAGTEMYEEKLKEDYFLEFSEGFSEMAERIEEEYLNSISDSSPAEDEQTSKRGTSGMLGLDIGGTLLKTWNQIDETTRIENWQEVLAVYLLREKQSGKTEFRMDEEDADGLAAVLKEMNPVVETTDGITIRSMKLQEYISGKSSITNDDIEFLETYTSSQCGILCAAATGLKGFIYESLGDNVSAERAQVVAAAYSLVGKVSYFWGGKSTAIGWDSRWGTQATVTAPGISDTGSIQSYGLDCSGFVTWAFINGYEDQKTASRIGHGTASQWGLSEAITEEEAVPGDLVFLQAPGNAGINHVGIVVGRNDDGSLVAVHCNAGDNGVTVESAYQAGFRYVRRPVIYS